MASLLDLTRSSRRITAFATAAITTALLALGGAGAASAALPILGYQSEESPTALIARDAAGLGSVGVDGINLSGPPGVVPGPTDAQRGQLAAAHAAGLPAALLVGNFSAKIGDFSEPLAWRTLGSTRATTALARRLGEDVRAEGWDGISVDFESLRARDAAGLVRLLADLRAELGSEASLTIAVQSYGSAAEYPANGYDLAGIARSVDQVVLMAYDQHGPWEKAPGPIGAEGWVRAGVRALLAKVPASQVDLGVAGYGYLWEPGHRRQLSDAAARALVSKDGAHARWVAAVGEWTAALPGGGVLWWSDARTLARREALAGSLGLHGLAVWSLGLSDPIGSASTPASSSPSALSSSSPSALASAAAPKWSGFQLPPKVESGGYADQAPLNDVSCPTEKLCVAVGALDTVAVSKAPGGGRDSWSVGYPKYAEPDKGCLEEESGLPPETCSFPRGSLESVSCPTEALCVAVGYEGTLWVSTDPTSGDWSISAPFNAGGQPHLTSVSCPTEALCVAVSGGNGKATGKVFTTSAPTSGIWQTAQLGGAPDLRAVSCTAESICMAGAKGGRIYVSTNPSGGAGTWHAASSPTPRDVEAVSCVAGLLCAAGDGGGNVLTSAEPSGASFASANAGGAVQITGLSCPTTTDCVAVDNNGDVSASTEPGGRAATWSFESLIPFEAESADHGQFVGNALWGASCPSASFCVLVGAKSRVFTSSEPFAAPAPSPPGAGAGAPGKATRKRPLTHLVFAEGFWKVADTPTSRTKAHFHFYSRDGAEGFECKRDRGHWSRCHSPLRYWVGLGRHTLRVRAIGLTDLRGPVATLHFKVDHRVPRQ